MEKKIQDYLHYYLGCDVITIDDNEKAQLVGVSDDNAHLVHEGTGSYGTCDITGIKPTLRRLEDIPDDEWIEIECETSIAPDAIGWYGVRESIMTMDTRHRFHWTITNEVLIILRKRNIDVDGLIDAGLAIDIKTLKP